MSWQIRWSDSGPEGAWPWDPAKTYDDLLFEAEIVLAAAHAIGRRHLRVQSVNKSGRCEKTAGGITLSNECGYPDAWSGAINELFDAGTASANAARLVADVQSVVGKRH